MANNRGLPTVLSEADEFVPDGYIAITELFSEGKYALPGYSSEQWCLGKKRIKDMRKKTYFEVKKRFDIAGVDSFSVFWNGNLDAINDLGINEFHKLICFKELSGAMICFETVEKNKSNDRRRRHISFGIKRSIYEKYYRNIRDAIRSGTIPKKISIADSRKKYRGDIQRFPTTNISLETNSGKMVMKLPKNEIFSMFERWCKIKKRKRSLAIYDALMALMEKDPVDGLGTLEAYSRRTDIGDSEVVFKDDSEEVSSISFKIPDRIMSIAKQIIIRYNKDPDNMQKPRLTESLYVSQAIDAFNRRVPLKYSDPVAFREYLEIKEAKEYNESVARRDKLD